ncbi:hypothetical protein V1288_005553 [Bradyrhizobium sp. AZCC 2176]
MGHSTDDGKIDLIELYGALLLRQSSHIRITQNYSDSTVIVIPMRGSLRPELQRPPRLIRTPTAPDRKCDVGDADCNRDQRTKGDGDRDPAKHYQHIHVRPPPCK